MNAEDAELVEIRPAQLADAAAIAAIYNESVEAGDATMDERCFDARDIEQRMRSLGEREAYLVLERNAELIAWGLLKSYSDRLGYRYTGETSIYVKRSELQRGYGSRLKGALIEHARERGYHHLVAKVFADNKASLAHNQRFGYELVGVQREVGFRNGRWQDVAILQLVLPGSP